MGNIYRAFHDFEVSHRGTHNAHVALYRPFEISHIARNMFVWSTYLN